MPELTDAERASVCSRRFQEGLDKVPVLATADSGRKTKHLLQFGILPILEASLSSAGSWDSAYEYCSRPICPGATVIRRGIS